MKTTHVLLATTLAFATAAGVLCPSAAFAGDATCVSCHPKQRDTPPHQVAVGDPCLYCHGKHATDHPTRGDKVTTRACGSEGCHATKTAPRPDLIRHEPFAFGWCTMCHEHQSTFLRPPVDRQVALCLNCHDREVIPPEVKGQAASAATSIHPPAGKGSIPCTFCHHHHEADKFYEVQTADGVKRIPNPKRLKRPERQLCAQCHRDLGSHHIAPGGATVEERYPRARDIPCGTCHEAHYAALPNLLKTGRSKAEMCASCHKLPGGATPSK